jgi:regulator of cell morphogenesis and NO signaling
MMTITQEHTIAEVVNQNFKTATLFQQYGLDFCCGGKKSIAKACGEKGVALPELMQKLELLMQQPAPHELNFEQLSLSDLIDHIVKKHHQYLHANLQAVSAYTQKVARVHGENHPDLIEVAYLFDLVKKDLEPHLIQEEQVLFPAIKALEQGLNPQVDLKAIIGALEAEHQFAGESFATIRRLTNQYQPPLAACNTWRVSFAELQEFEADLHEHVHLENNLLYPKAIKLIEAISLTASA